ncbi:MAG: DUF805 domain-containing protein [Bacteroidales bacterium]|nr:DUF805 domain-containing protein [Bacteroidales bacterium]
MKENFIDILKNHYFDLEGRARRKEFWMFLLWYFILYIPIYIIAFVLTYITEVAYILPIVVGIFCLALIAPSFSLVIRRLHDIGKSGWYWLVGLIPFIGGIILLVWYCTEGTIGPNEYGPDPKAAERGGVVAQ